MLEQKVRAFLLKSLGAPAYLGLVSDIYIRLIKAGFMKQKYRELFYLKKLVQPGFTCLDIGANVGYYSVFLSQYAGPKGHVLSVEPVPLFAQIFQQNAAKFALNNIRLKQVALGSEEKMITLVTPMINGVFRHGLTKISDQQNVTDDLSYPAQMVVPDQLLANLERLDFLKCDVEGYEVHLFPHMMATLERWKPIVQIELSTAENRRAILDLLQPIGYNAYRLKEEQLVQLSENELLTYEEGDYYFLHQTTNHPHQRA